MNKKQLVELLINNVTNMNNIAKTAIILETFVFINKHNLVNEFQNEVLKKILIDSKNLK